MTSKGKYKLVTKFNKYAVILVIKQLSSRHLVNTASLKSVVEYRL